MYKLSTVEDALGDVQFSGHESWIWYSQVPLLALQKPILGRMALGKELMRGLNVHAPMEVLIVSGFTHSSFGTLRTLVKGRIHVLFAWGQDLAVEVEGGDLL